MKIQALLRGKLTAMRFYKKGNMPGVAALSGHMAISGDRGRVGVHSSKLQEKAVLGGGLTVPHKLLEIAK